MSRPVASNAANARFLDAPVPTRGRPGFFDAAIPRALAEKYGVSGSA